MAVETESEEEKLLASSLRSAHPVVEGGREEKLRVRVAHRTVGAEVLVSRSKLNGWVGKAEAAAGQEQTDLDLDFPRQY